ncbi:MAG: methylmalonyl Co-A mutase-associated GTPase MeaB [Chitinophagaceae bacterium]
MPHTNSDLIQKIKNQDFRAIAKAVSLVENKEAMHEEFLAQLENNPKTKIIGVTGPPGAGKSTLINALLKHWTTQDKKIAVVSIDPSSPFNFGALLGDRIRMRDFYLNPNVFIRSLASRGSLGGMSARVLEVCDVLSAAQFDYIIVETVGVGQSEVEIAGLAHTTIVVLVPEAGDEIQTMKAGLMEIADIFVVNKSDRPQSDIFIKNLKLLAHEKANTWEIPVVACIASEHEGIDQLTNTIQEHLLHEKDPLRQALFLAEKLYKLIQEKRMQDVDKHLLLKQIKQEITKENFSIYHLLKSY